MTTFAILSKESEFIKLDAKRGASLDTLTDHNEAINALDQEKPSVRLDFHDNALLETAQAPINFHA